MSNILGCWYWSTVYYISANTTKHISTVFDAIFNRFTYTWWEVLRFFKWDFLQNWNIKILPFYNSCWINVPNTALALGAEINSVKGFTHDEAWLLGFVSIAWLLSSTFLHPSTVLRGENCLCCPLEHLCFPLSCCNSLPPDTGRVFCVRASLCLVVAVLSCFTLCRNVDSLVLLCHLLSSVLGHPVESFLFMVMLGFSLDNLLWWSLHSELK